MQYMVAMRPLGATLLVLPILASGLWRVPVPNASVDLVSTRIHEVMNVLADMSAKVEAEGERQNKVYHKFAAICQKFEAELQATSLAAKFNSSDLNQKVKMIEREEENLSKSEEVQQNRAKAVKREIVMSSARRQRESRIAEAILQENKATIEAVAYAVESNLSMNFRHSPAAALLRRMIESKMVIGPKSRDLVMGILNNASVNLSANSTKEVVDILLSLKNVTETNTTITNQREGDANAANLQFIASLTQDSIVLHEILEDIKAKLKHLDDQSAIMSENAEDYTDTARHATDVLAKLHVGCTNRKAALEEDSQSRSAELSVITESVRLLSGATDIIKTAMAGWKPKQLSAAETSAQEKALAVLRTPASRSPWLDLVAYALQKKVDNTKVANMIRSMVAAIEQESLEDGNRKEFCVQKFGPTGNNTSPQAMTSLDEEELIWKPLKAEQDLTDYMPTIKVLDTTIVSMYLQRRADKAVNTKLLSNTNAVIGRLNATKEPLSNFYCNESASHAIPKVQVPDGPDRYTKSAGGGSLVTSIDEAIKDLDVFVARFATEEAADQAVFESVIRNATLQRNSYANRIQVLQTDLEAHETAVKLHTKSPKPKFDVRNDCVNLLKYFGPDEEERNKVMKLLVKAESELIGQKESVFQIHPDTWNVLKDTLIS